MKDASFIPYQEATSPTPASPEYVSGNSTSAAAAATVLKLFTGSDRFGHSITIPAGSSKIEPALTPAHPITLWTFTDAANQAGMAGRYGGIHSAPPTSPAVCWRPGCRAGLVESANLLQRHVGAQLESGLDEAFGFAIGARGVGTGKAGWMPSWAQAWRNWRER
jgi:hypothetical protein